MPVVLAHQGGWDEILLVVGPIVVCGILLLVAKRRAEQEAAEEAAAQRADAEPTDDGVVGDPPGSAG